MKLTWEETKEIANRLDEVISNNFHDAMYNVLWDCKGGEEIEISDEDILAIKEQLKLIL
jgi:Mn-dependent DtxR family transcriptional regulator